MLDQSCLYAYWMPLIELLITAIHPFNIPGVVTLRFSDYPVLYFWMLIRIPFSLRVFLLQSDLFGSTKVEAIAAFYKVRTGGLTYDNVRLITRSLFSNRGMQISSFMVVINWLAEMVIKY